MRVSKFHSTCWGFGLTSADETTLARLFGGAVDFTHWPLTGLPGPKRIQSDNPLLIFASPASEAAIASLSRKTQKDLAEIPTIILLPEGYTREDMEQAISANPTKIIRNPLTKKLVWDLLLEAHEALSIKNDIRCMTRELLLERELLERKNEMLSFLVNFFSTIGKDFCTENILARTFEGFSHFLPVSSMHAAVWQNGQKNARKMELFLNTEADSHQERTWKATLLDEARKQWGAAIDDSVIRQFRLPLSERESMLPDAGNYFPLYFSDKANISGIILLVYETQRPLGRDQTESLALALDHLGLVLSSAYMYRQAREEADVDELTGMYNRRHFSSALSHEMHRVARYGQPLALMMLDLDHFKKVNDTYGHPVGDMVLAETARIIKKELRTTDYCARLGGEEFCAILPATDKKQALRVARRVRQSIANCIHTATNGSFSVTASIGLAYLNQHDNKTARDFMQEADTCLYIAKDSGRNRVEDSYGVQQQIPLAVAHA